ncbi:MAG: hypothetical protein HQM08_10450 [Candidatus Riflebacteria bacterium]|nr:hypothetical protein [Candidatus Riflebacteria bacterium]
MKVFCCFPRFFGKRRSGIALIEIMVALIIFMLAILPLLDLFYFSSSQTESSHSSQMVIRSLLETSQQLLNISLKPGMRNILGNLPEDEISKFQRNFSESNSGGVSELSLGPFGWKVLSSPIPKCVKERKIGIQKLWNSDVLRGEIFKTEIAITLQEGKSPSRTIKWPMMMVLEK